MVLYDAFNNEKGHGSDVGSMIIDQLKTHVLIFGRNDLRDDSLQVVKFDFGIQTSELSACAKSDNELFKRSHKVRPGHEHEHQMVECSAQK